MLAIESIIEPESITEFSKDLSSKSILPTNIETKGLNYSTDLWN